MALWNGKPLASADDAKQDGTTMTLTDAQITLSSGVQWGGLRFPNCTIPQGSVIQSAVLTLNLVAGNTSPDGLTIYGEAADNSAAFTTGASNISNRTRTSANVVWSGTSLGGGDKTAPDVAAVVSEIISRPGWASGNALSLVLDSMASSSFRFTAYDSSTTLCARLDVTTAEGAAVKMRHYLDMMR